MVWAWLLLDNNYHQVTKIPTFLSLQHTCLSTVMMKNSMEKHRMYPEWRPCQIVRKRSVVTWDRVLLPKNFNRLKTCLKQKEEERETQVRSHGSSLFWLWIWIKAVRNAPALTAYMESTHLPGSCCCIATEVILKRFNNFSSSTRVLINSTLTQTLCYNILDKRTRCYVFNPPNKCFSFLTTHWRHSD